MKGVFFVSVGDTKPKGWHFVHGETIRIKGFEKVKLFVHETYDPILSRCQRWRISHIDTGIALVTCDKKSGIREAFLAKLRVEKLNQDQLLEKLSKFRKIPSPIYERRKKK